MRGQVVDMTTMATDMFLFGHPRVVQLQQLEIVRCWLLQTRHPRVSLLRLLLTRHPRVALLLILHPRVSLLRLLLTRHPRVALLLFLHPRVRLLRLLRWLLQTRHPRVQPMVLWPWQIWQVDRWTWCWGLVFLP